MSRQASPTLIGAFVIGALALVVVGLLVFGGGRFFADRETWVTYFPGSVKGLRVGAPVDFRGVTIGEVTRISILYDDQDGSLLIPVVYELTPDQIIVIGPASEERTTEEAIEDLIRRGLRAQLQVTSLVTGLMSVDLDFYPDAPLDLVSSTNPDLTGYPELPAVPSRMEELEQTLAEVMQEVPGLLKDVRGLLGEITSGNTAESINRILLDVAHFTDTLDKATPAIQRMMGQTEESIAALHRVADTADQILSANQERIGTTMIELQSTLVAVRRMADQVNNLAAENRAGLRDFTSTGLYEITGLAQDAQRMVNEITRLTEELERDPARFFFGDRAGGVRAE